MFDEGNAFSGTGSAEFSGVAAVKFPHKGACRDVHERFSGIFGVRVTFPFDEILHSPSCPLGVEDSFDLEMVLAVKGQRGGGNP